MVKKSLIFGFILIIVSSFAGFSQDEMLYYETFYPGYLREVNERIRQEIISYLQSKIKEFDISEDLSEKLKEYAEKCGNYEAIDPMEFIKDIDLKYSKIWALKGKVFSQKDISEKLDNYSSLFQTLNMTRNVKLTLSMTGELEKGFNFVMIFFTP